MGELFVVSRVPSSVPEPPTPVSILVLDGEVALPPAGSLLLGLVGEAVSSPWWLWWWCSCGGGGRPSWRPAGCLVVVVEVAPPFKRPPPTAVVLLEGVECVTAVCCGGTLNRPGFPLIPTTPGSVGSLGGGGAPAPTPGGWISPLPLPKIGGPLLSTHGGGLGLLVVVEVWAALMHW